MITTLIFDCFGVLYWDNVGQLYDSVEPKDFEAVSDLVHAFDHGYVDNDDFLAQVAAIAKSDSATIAEIMVNKRRRNEPLIERVKQLKQQYKISLLTNMGQDTMASVFSSEESQQLFDDIVISSDVGLIKPSLDIFELTLDRLGVQPNEAIFIDDRPANTEGAERAGMKSILFTSNRQFEQELQRIIEVASA